MVSLTLTKLSTEERPGLRPCELGRNDLKRALSPLLSLDMLALFCPASGAGLFRGGSLTCHHSGLS